MHDAVLFDARDEGIAVITLNRPDQRNALGRDIREGLFQAWDRFERDPSLRVAILTGAAMRRSSGAVAIHCRVQVRGSPQYYPDLQLT